MARFSKAPLAIALITSTVAFAQRAEYAVPLTHADLSPEWYAFTQMVGFALAEEEQADFGRNLTMDRYGFSEPVARELLRQVILVRERNRELGPTPYSICRADISSAAEYVKWWRGFGEIVVAYREMVVADFVEAIGDQLWNQVLSVDYVEWLERKDFGTTFDRQEQVATLGVDPILDGMCSRGTSAERVDVEAVQ